MKGIRVQGLLYGRCSMLVLNMTTFWSLLVVHWLGLAIHNMTIYDKIPVTTSVLH